MSKLLKKEGSNFRGEVAVGSDGELFLLSSRHRTLDFIKGKSIISDEFVGSFEETMIRRERLTNELGARFLHLVAPDKHVVLKEKFPFDIVYSLGWDVFKKSSFEFLYPADSDNKCNLGKRSQLS